ncbi:MAG: hypothetical protein WD512_04785 [Candidatus Paceibacterota bacterium]
MWFYIISGLFLVFVLIYEPKYELDRSNSDLQTNYYVSLVTVKNDANAPFYYHTSLELIKNTKELSNNSLRSLRSLRSYVNYCTNCTGSSTDERISYGFYPDHSGKNNIFKPLKSIYRFLRPIYAMPGRIRSPDPLYEGSVELGIKPGQVVYTEHYPVTEKEWFNLKYQIAHATVANDLILHGKISSLKSIPLFYSYTGIYLSDNCSSWVRKLLKKHLNVGLSCQHYRFEAFGLQFAVPIFPFDFPPLCGSPGIKGNRHTKYRAFGSTNTTNTR